MKAKIYLKNDTIEIEVPDSTIIKNQKKEITKEFSRDRYILTLRFDDNCGNGHNSFAATIDHKHKAKNGRWVDHGGGSDHVLMSKIFPEYKHLIQWHLVSTEGPMHYLGNALYHASNRDHWGLLKGEVRSYDTRLKFKDFPILFDVRKPLLTYLEEMKGSNFDLEMFEVFHKKEPETYGSKWTFGTLPQDWYKCPFRSEEECSQFLEALQSFEYDFVKTPVAWGEGKEPDLSGAQSCAVWPESTLSDYTVENLLERLPDLMERFRADMNQIFEVY